MKRSHDSMRGKVVLPVLCALAILSYAGNVTAIIYVATNGVAPNDGSKWSSAYTNIQEALNAASLGETIYLAGHTFYVTNQLFWNANTNMIIRGGFAATNDADQPGIPNNALWPTVLTRYSTNRTRILSITNITDSIIEGVTIRDGYPLNGTYGCGIAIWRCTGLVFSACTIASNTFYATADTAVLGGGIYSLASTVTFSNCMVNSNSLNITGNYGGATLSGAGLYMAGGAVTLVHSTIAGNALIQTQNIPYGGGITVAGGFCRLRNCLVQGNSSYRGPGTGLYQSGASTTLLENCTVAHNIGHGIARVGGTMTATNSIFWGNLDDVTGAVTLVSCDIQTPDTFWTNGNNGCFSSNPLFEYGYYLAAGSPCRGAGTNSSESWGLTNATTLVAGTPDAGSSVDLGYHYRTGFDLTYADLYVAPAPAGSDGHAGTSAALPLATIGKAISMSQNGTRIHIAAGNYTTNTEVFPLSMTWLNGIKILGTNAATTMIDAQGSSKRVLTLARSAGTLFEKLTFTGGKPSTAMYGCGISITDCGETTISGCSIISNEFTITADRTVLGCGIYIAASDVAVSNCLVSRNRMTIAGNYNSNLSGGGLYLDISGRLTMRETIISSNTCSAQNGREGAGVNIGAGQCLMKNCLVTGNLNPGQEASAGISGKGTGLYLNNIGASMHLDNCTVVNNTNQGICQVSGVLTVTNSIVWGNTDDVTGVVVVAFSDIQTTDLFWTNEVNGCISVDPLFADINYYHPQSKGGHYVNGYLNGGTWAIGLSNSPCLDKGNPNDDFSLEPSPNGKIRNMGYDGNTLAASKSHRPAGAVAYVH